MMNAACQLPFWMQLLQALSVPTLAAFGIYIALRQWLTARERLRLDLFDRRREAYAGLRRAIAPINANAGKIRNEDIQAFSLAMEDMHFLFDRKLEAMVLEILKAMGEKHIVDMQLNGKPSNAKDLSLKSVHLSDKISRGVNSEIPARMESFLRFRRNS